MLKKPQTMKKSILRVVFLFVLLLNLSCKALIAQTALVPSGGGTSDDPYLIASLENLYWVATEVNQGRLGRAYFEQIADIDASETSVWFGGEGWVPIGNSDNVFSGIYDGGGNVIDGLVVNRPDEDHTGLFGYSQSAILQNIGLKSVYVTGKVSGALTGGSYFTDIVNCHSSGVLHGTGPLSGGLVGLKQLGSLISSSSKTNVTGIGRAGGLVGAIEDSHVENCFSTGSVCGGEGTTNTNIGGLVGHLSFSGTIVNSFSSGDVSNGDVLGGLVAVIEGENAKYLIAIPSAM